MKYRLNFDDQIFASLIGKVGARANGGSLNKALQTMVIEWNALEDDKKPSSSRQVPVKFPSNQANSEDRLDDAWG